VTDSLRVRSRPFEPGSRPLTQSSFSRTQGSGWDHLGVTLFTQESLWERLSSLEAKASTFVDEAGESEIVADPDGVVDRILDGVTPLPLHLDLSGMSRLPGREVVKKVDRGYPYGVMTFRGTQYDFLLPFSGSRELTEWRPSQWTMGGVDADVVRAGEIQISVVADNEDATTIEAQAVRIAKQIESHATTANSDVASWRSTARPSLLARANRRKTNFEAMRRVDAAFSIPLRETSSAPVAIPVKPTVVSIRPSSSARESATPKGARAKPDPVLQGDVADAVVERIIGVGNAMERLPLTARKFGETELRDMLLFMLNANFGGLARAEVFNGNGKTDILMPWEDRNAFIAECKFWDGPAKFVDALNQLLSYLVWRDTRAALIIFIREGAPTAIIEKCDQEIRAHSNFVSAGPVTDVAGPRDYVLTSTKDPDRKINLTFIPFVVQVPEKLERESSAVE
jgi:hypothetical protein